MNVSKHKLFILCVFVLLAVLCGCNDKTESIDTSDDVIGKEYPSSEEASSAVDPGTAENLVVDGHQSPEAVTYDAETVGSVIASGDMMPIKADCELDINMDGEAEHIFLETEKIGDGYWYSCTLHINDLEYMIDTRIILDVMEGEELPFYIFSPDGKQLALALAARDNSYNSENYVFLYDGAEIKELSVWGDIQRYDKEKECLFVKTLVAQIQWHSTVRACRLELNAEGTEEFIFQDGYSDYFTVDPFTGENKVFILKNDLKGYTDCSLNADTIIMQAGTELIVLGGDANEWVLVQTVDDSSTCWLPIGSGYIVIEDSHIEVGEYFENIDIAN